MKRNILEWLICAKCHTNILFEWDFRPDNVTAKIKLEGQNAEKEQKRERQSYKRCVITSVSCV